MKKIYKIVNTVNDKIYIGKTIKKLEDRFNAHLYEAKRYAKCCLEKESFGYNSLLYPAMIKYGCENFKIELISDFPDDVNLENLEIEYIKKFNACDPNIGYNISPGGLGGPLFKGHIHSDKVRKLASLRTKGIPQSKEFVEKRVHKHRKRYQNLNTGEIFEGAKAAEQVYGGSIPYAVKYNGKANGYFWVMLDDNHFNGYDEIERSEIVAIREQDLHKRRVEAVMKGKQTQSEEAKKKAIEKRVLTYKERASNRTREEKLRIARNISQSLKGKKHSPERIQKLKDYYKTTPLEELELRWKRNGDGQRGKKRYENVDTGKHKMFIPGQQPEGWVIIISKPKPMGKRKFTNKITGKHKMFFPEDVDTNLWERTRK